MQIIQISDLHITEESNLDLIKNRIVKLYNALQPILNKDECTIVCILGDIVDKGDATLYDTGEAFGTSEKVSLTTS